MNFDKLAVGPNPPHGINCHRRGAAALRSDQVPIRQDRWGDRGRPLPVHDEILPLYLGLHPDGGRALRGLPRDHAGVRQGGGSEGRPGLAPRRPGAARRCAGVYASGRAARAPCHDRVSDCPPWRARHQPSVASDRARAHLDSCHALARDGDVVRQHHPHWYTGPASEQDAWRSARRACLGRGQRREGQCMDLGVHEVAERGEHHALPLEPALAGKRCRYN